MSNNSIWELESYFAPVDIIIAGSGLGGLWSAYYLKKRAPELQVLVIDKGIVPTGASTRNAGFACFGSVTELLEDAQLMGEDRMLELVQMRFEGLSRLKKTFKKNEIGYEHSGGYELIGDKQFAGKNEIREVIGYLNKLLSQVTNNQATFRLADDRIRDFGFRNTRHLVHNKFEGQLHSGNLMQALAAKVQAMGTRIMSGVELKRTETSGQKILCYTNHDAILTTNQLLLCTNAFTNELLPGIEMTANRGQVLVTSPISSLPFKGSFHYDEGYYYFRNLGDRVLAGGARNTAFEEEKTADFMITDRIQNELERFLTEVVLPHQHFTIDYRWSGIMGMSNDKFPVIKELQPNIFCAVGMGGIGVALAPVIGERVAKLMRREK